LQGESRTEEDSIEKADLTKKCPAENYRKIRSAERITLKRGGEKARVKRGD